MKKQKVFLFAGASGTGKTTLLNYLEKEGVLNNVVTTTTRPKRAGEVDGVDYNFVTVEEMFEMHRNGLLAEPPNEYSGNFYACSKTALISDKPVGIILDPNGVNIIGESLKNDDRFEYRIVFLPPIDKNEFLRRLKERGSSDEEIKSRLAIYEEESSWKDRIVPDLILNPKDGLDMLGNFERFKVMIETEIAYMDREYQNKMKKGR